MADREQVSGRSASRAQFLPVLALFVGGLVHCLLPRGAFGTYDIAARAGITGVSTAVCFVGLYMISRRWHRSPA